MVKYLKVMKVDGLLTVTKKSSYMLKAVLKGQSSRYMQLRIFILLITRWMSLGREQSIIVRETW